AIRFSSCGGGSGSLRRCPSALHSRFTMIDWRLIAAAAAFISGVFARLEASAARSASLDVLRIKETMTALGSNADAVAAECWRQPASSSTRIVPSLFIEQKNSSQERRQWLWDE